MSSQAVTQQSTSSMPGVAPRPRKRRAPAPEANGRRCSRKDRANKRRRREDLEEQDDKDDLDMPVPEDFDRPYGNLRVSDFIWAEKPADPIFTAENMPRAPPPCIPRLGIPTSCIQVPMRSPAAVEQQLVVPKVPACLATMPQEVREEIYRHLLIESEPIAVHECWSRVFKRRGHRKSELWPDILRVCKAFHEEATPILYGENTFIYQMREPRADLVDVDRLVAGDAEQLNNEDTNSEYEDDEAAGGAQPRRSRRTKTENPPDIDIPKYGHLFRRIIIQAERNRFKNDDRLKMAQAISLFTPKTPRNPKALTGNINTLTIRVYPLQKEGNQPTSGPRQWTFDDFFAKDSPLIQALVRLECQFLRVELVWERARSSHRSTAIIGPHKTLKADLRPLRLQRRALAGLPDTWSKDKAKLWYRNTEAVKCGRAVQALRQRVQAAYKARSPHNDVAWDDDDDGYGGDDEWWWWSQ